MKGWWVVRHSYQGLRGRCPIVNQGLVGCVPHVVKGWWVVRHSQPRAGGRCATTHEGLVDGAPWLTRGWWEVRHKCWDVKGMVAYNVPNPWTLISIRLLIIPAQDILTQEGSRDRRCFLNECFQHSPGHASPLPPDPLDWALIAHLCLHSSQFEEE